MEENLQMEFKPIKEYLPEFWEGKTNQIVRLWVYLNRGLDVANQLKYVVAGILALYVILKFTNPVWIAVMFVVSLPILTFIGRWHLYKAAKSQEYITTIKGSVTGYGNYNLQIQIAELLEQILAKLNEKKS